MTFIILFFLGAVAVLAVTLGLALLVGRRPTAVVPPPAPPKPPPPAPPKAPPEAPPAPPPPARAKPAPI
ncbi:MAG TPA: hypothetical protein VJ010_05225, partial [Actinomycetota bacterium]|nr:hypothetical protein [Actinomycetota bacterium]